MGRMTIYLKKSLNIFFWILDKIDKKKFVIWYPKYLKWLGIQINIIEQAGTWISPSVFFDSSNYNLITIGYNVTISFDVAILCHDYSIIHAAITVNKRVKEIIFKKVIIGNNVFIGARSLILPGARIGDNCIIGGGSVVKGTLEPNSIYAGNPARKIGNIEDLALKYDNNLI